jgi:hypothetical protein
MYYTSGDIKKKPITLSLSKLKSSMLRNTAVRTQERPQNWDFVKPTPDEGVVLTKHSVILKMCRRHEQTPAKGRMCTSCGHGYRGHRGPRVTVASCRITASRTELRPHGKV